MDDAMPSDSGKKAKMSSWFSKGKGDALAGISKYTGPLGKQAAKFDDKAAERAFANFKAAAASITAGSAGMEKSLALASKMLPKVKEYSQKGWHFQLPNMTDAKKGALMNTKDAAEAKKKKMKALKEEQEDDDDEEVTVAEKQAKIKAEKVDDDAKGYKDALGNLGGLAKKIADKREQMKMDRMPEKLKKQVLKMRESAKAFKENMKAPLKATQWDLENKKKQKKAETDKVRSFDEAVFEQIRVAEMESGQKLRPGAYFKILDKNGNGVLERGESAAVDELFATGDIMKGEDTAGEKSDKITYEQYKLGIRDAKKNFDKLYSSKMSGHIKMDEAGH